MVFSKLGLLRIVILVVRVLSPLVLVPVFARRSVVRVLPVLAQMEVHWHFPV